MALRMIWPLCSAGLDRSNELPSALVARPLSGATAGLLLTSALNNTGHTRLQLLIWRSPSLPIGTWTALAGLCGAGLSAISVLLLVPSNPPLRRQRHQPLERSRSEPPMSEVAQRLRSGTCGIQPPLWLFPTDRSKSRVPISNPLLQSHPQHRDDLIPHRKALKAGETIQISTGEMRPMLTTVRAAIWTR